MVMPTSTIRSVSTAEILRLIWPYYTAVQYSDLMQYPNPRVYNVRVVYGSCGGSVTGSGPSSSPPSPLPPLGALVCVCGNRSLFAARLASLHCVAAAGNVPPPPPPPPSPPLLSPPRLQSRAGRPPLTNFSKREGAVSGRDSSRSPL